MKHILWGIALFFIYAQAAQAQATWGDFIPDPDIVDWSSNDRPGYRYRGMMDGQQQFYDYIQAKRARGEQLSSAENAMIRHLQTIRCWPDPPVPNDFWKSYIRYLRDQPTTSMNFAQRKMLWFALSRGIIPLDTPVTHDGTRKIIDYLNSRSYRARNWFERSVGRFEPWLEHYVGSFGYDMRDGTGGGGGGGVFPPTKDFNGMRIHYNVAGIDLGEYTDTDGFTTRRNYSGTVGPGRITISGTAVADVGHHATLKVFLRAGNMVEQDEWRIEVPGRKEFSISIDVPPNANLEFPRPQFYIRLSAAFSTAGTPFSRGLQVAGTFTGDPQAVAAQRERDDAEWREEVERTLRELGYEQTPAGRQLAEMRAALEGGDDAWREYVNRRQRELGYQEGPPEENFDALAQAMETGGDMWARYVADNSGRPQGAATPATPVTPAPAAPAADQQPAAAPTDMGGLAVGTGRDGGTITNPGNHFPSTNTVTGMMNYTNLPEGSTAVASWSLDGKEVATSQQAVSGNGRMSFTLQTGQARSLPSGTYTLTVTVGGTVLGRKTFTVGTPGQDAAGTTNGQTAGGAADTTAPTAPGPDVPGGHASEHVTLPRAVFSPQEEITLRWHNLPGNQNDWFSVVPVDSPDTTWGTWWYAQGEAAVTRTIGPLAAGEYEVRVYYDWPRGSYNVQSRLRFTVR